MLKTSCLRVPSITVETATCLANASRFPGFRLKCRSEFPKEIIFRCRPRTTGSLRKIKDRRIVNLHCACKVESQQRDEPRAIHIETGYLARRCRRSQGGGMWLPARDYQPISYAGRANPANCQPLGNVDFQLWSTAALRGRDRADIGKRRPAAGPGSSRRPLERHAEAIGTRLSFANLRIGEAAGQPASPSRPDLS